MKILFLITEGSLGGAERCLLDLIASMRAARPDVELGLIAGGAGPLLDEVARLGAKAAVLELPPVLATLGDSAVRSRTPSTRSLASTFGASVPAFARYVRALRKEIDAFGADILHTNGLKMHILGSIAARRSVRVVWYLQDFVSDRRLASRALRAVARRANLVVANSEAVRRDVATVAPHLPSRAVLNAIDTDAFVSVGEVAPLDLLAGLPETRGEVRVGLVATYARWKGQDIFLEAVRLASPRCVGARFYIVGSAIYRTTGQFSEEELRAKAKELGVADDVAFVPFQKNPADVFRALDVVVHASSRPEPFGRTIVEGMACGRAVIAVDAGGASEIIRHESNGLAIPPADPEALAEAIVRLANDPDLRARLGAEARRDAVARFSRERLATDMLKAYEAMSG